MNAAYIPPPYPFKAFHHLVRDVALELQRNIQAPDALIGMSLLAGMTVASQGLVDVRLPTGRLRPLALNFLLIGVSGERKSEVDDVVMQPLKTADKERATDFETKLSAYRIAERLWKLSESAYSSAFKKAVLREEPADEIAGKLVEHGAIKPIKPRLRQFLRSDASERGLHGALEGDGESILLSADEGHIVLGSGAINRVGFRNAEWGGASVAIDRAGGEHVAVRNPRVSIMLMLPPAVLKSYLDRHGDLVRGSGHWARYLVGWPASTQGTRFASQSRSVWEHLPAFHARMSELLDEYGHKVDSGNVDRTVIEFSDDATSHWFDVVNKTEALLQPWGYLRDIHDFASKAMEIAARIAAVMHHFSGQDGRVSVDTLQRALEITEWHLHEFKRIFSPQIAVPQVQLDARALALYLQTHYFGIGVPVAPRNAVLRNGPVRPQARFREALDLLLMQNKIGIVIDPKRKRYINQGPNWGVF